MKRLSLFAGGASRSAGKSRMAEGGEPTNGTIEPEDIAAGMAECVLVDPVPELPEARPYADPEPVLIDFLLESEDADETLPFELTAGTSFFPFLLLLPLFFRGRMDKFYLLFY